MKVHLTLKSSNSKTGPIPVSTTSAESCPPSCPLQGGGCYAKSGPLALHWKKTTDGSRGMEWDEFVREIEKLPKNTIWRHNQAGDLPGVGEEIDAMKLFDLVEANRGKRGFTYTHKTSRPDLLLWANEEGFTINLSGNSPAHADELVKLGAGPVVTVLPAEFVGRTTVTPKGRHIVVCPAYYKEGMNCSNCGLCQKSDRKSIIGFPAHGTYKKKATAIANG